MDDELDPTQCGNCGEFRTVDDQGYVEECRNCGDDEWNIHEIQDQFEIIEENIYADSLDSRQLDSN